jgi:glycosyltransferase involved in cell wall biosynthesis
MNPPVSIILPTLNERDYLRDCLDSLLAQDYQSIDEILVVDGGSKDGSRAIAESFGAPVRLVDNPKVTAAGAMNVGLAVARNDLVVRADAHTLYASDFVRRNVDVLLETGAAVVGGPMKPVGISPFGRAVAAVTSSPFGVGPGRFHYSQQREEVETVYLGAYLRSTVLNLGGYDDERLQWAAEDQELNFRIRRNGGRIIVDPSIRSVYFPRQTARSLARQYHNYGMCKASTLAKHRTLPYWRPVVPAAMVGGTVVWVLVTLPTCSALASLPVFLYLAAASLASRKISGGTGVTPHRVVAALAICHWSYGAGLWRGLGRIITRRPFDVRPRAGR